MLLSTRSVHTALRWTRVTSLTYVSPSDRVQRSSLRRSQVAVRGTRTETASAGRVCVCVCVDTKLRSSEFEVD
jgi:hypothetical protein